MQFIIKSAGVMLATISVISFGFHNISKWKTDGYSKHQTYLAYEQERSDCKCDSLFNRASFVEYEDLLQKTITAKTPVWKNFRFNDATYVVEAGVIGESEHCLSLWKNGENISRRCLSDKPKMLTPLYTYYLNYDSASNIDSKRFETASESREFKQWMDAFDIKTAIYLPVEYTDLPFEIPTNIKVQLATHEAFHVEVMLRKWYTGKAHWPSWDKQPDGNSVMKCYNADAIVEVLINKEQRILSALITSLLDSNKDSVISLGEKFMEVRKKRYQRIDSLRNQGWELPDCSRDEGLMEIEEGIADYASWVKMFELGIFSREELIRRYNAKQKAIYYMSGCMLFHASVLMCDGDDQLIIDQLIEAPTVEKGLPFRIFKDRFGRYRAK